MQYGANIISSLPETIHFLDHQSLSTGRTGLSVAQSFATHAPHCSSSRVCSSFTRQAQGKNMNVGLTTGLSRGSAT